jgi:hypothetical protein
VVSGVIFPSAEDIAHSRKQGFAQLWPVGDDYEILEGRLYEINTAGRYIAPAGSPQLVSELARLHEGDEAVVRSFATRWGLLGWWELLQEDQGRMTSDAFVELGRAHQRSETDSRIGEPLPWIWAHAHGIRLCLEILKYLKRGDDAGLDRWIADRRVAPLPDHPTTRLPGLRYAVGHLPYTAVVTANEEPAAMGWHLIRMVVNPNLVGIRQVVEPATPEGHGVLPMRAFRALTDMAYWQLAEMAWALTRDVGALGICEACGLAFKQEDRRQRYCPPPRWKDDQGRWQGPTESLCAKKARMARLRQTKPAARPGRTPGQKPGPRGKGPTS